MNNVCVHLTQGGLHYSLTVCCIYLITKLELDYSLWNDAGDLSSSLEKLFTVFFYFFNVFSYGYVGELASHFKVLY